MRRDRYLSIFILAGCMAAVVLAATLIGYSFGASADTTYEPPVVAAALQIEEPPSTPTSTPPPVQITEPPITSGSISIPGFEWLTVQGQTLHAESISNPARNTCYFIVALMLADGTEVYRSGVLSPGQAVGAVELSKALAPGMYGGAIARYSCYALENMQPLNGADVTFTLEVLS